MHAPNARAFLHAATAAVALTGSSTAAPFFFGGSNVVANGGFETGDFSAWTETGPCQYVASAAISCSGVDVNPGPHSGSYAAFLGAIPGTLAQTMSTNVGVYQLSFYVANTKLGGIATPNSINVLWNGTSIYSATNSPASGYGNFSFVNLLATGSTANLEFDTSQTPAYWVLDDVKLVEVDDGDGNNIAAASQTVAVQASRDFIHRLTDRFGHSGSPMQLAAAGETVVASNDGMAYVNGPGNYRAFLSVYGDDARYDNGDTRARRNGFSVGAEWAPSNSFDLGLAVSVGKAWYKTFTSFTDNTGNTDETLGALYGHWSPQSNPFYATGIVGYGHSSNDFMRTNFFGAVGAGDVVAEQWFGAVEAGWDCRAWSQLTSTPFARLEGAQVRQDGYMEHAFGGTLVPALVDSKDQSAERSLLGIRLTTDFNAVGRYLWQISAKAAWAHEFDRSRSVTFSEATLPATFFGSASAAIPTQNSAVVGANVEIPLTDHASSFAGYNGDFGASGQRIHQGEVGVRVTW